MSSNRNNYLDIIKGITIILVIIGHCIQFGMGNYYYQNELYFDNIVFKIIYSFHMFLFALISGYLFYYSHNKDGNKKCFIKKIKTLFIPIAIWSTILFMMYFVKNINNISMILLFKKYVYTLLNSFWFLSTILISSIIIIINKILFKNSIITYILLLIVLLFIPDINISKYIAFLLFPYVLGYFANKYSIMNGYSKIKHKWLVFIGLLVLFLLLFMLFNKNTYIYTSGYSMIKNGSISLIQLFYNMIRWLIGLTGSLLLLCGIQNIKINNKVLSYVGKNTFGIYIISTLLFKTLLKITCDLEFNYIFVIIETIAVLLISLLLNMVIKKIKICNKLLLGGR